MIRMEEIAAEEKNIWVTSENLRHNKKMKIV